MLIRLRLMIPTMAVALPIAVTFAKARSRMYRAWMSRLEEVCYEHPSSKAVVWESASSRVSRLTKLRFCFFNIRFWSCF
jgi:hypothetical protein